MPTVPAHAVDILPADRFVKAGDGACIRQEDNPRHTLCDATGYVLEPEFGDKESPQYVDQYCVDCQEEYRKKTGNVATSEADTIG